MIRTLLLAALTLAIALGGGLAATWLALRAPERDAPGWAAAERLVPMTLHHPFALVLGRNEGAAFTATLDASGKPLRGACDYRVAGRLPPSRLWTLVAAGRRDPARVSALQSLATLRQSDGSDAVTISAHPSPGNWLDLAGQSEFTLTLSLYGSAVNDGTGFADLHLPQIETLRCDE